MFVVGPYATQWILLLVNLGDINYGWDVRWLLSDNNLVFRNIWQGISQRGERLRQGSTIILMVYARSKYIRFMSSCWSLFGILRIFWRLNTYLLYPMMIMMAYISGFGDRINGNEYQMNNVANIHHISTILFIAFT